MEDARFFHQQANTCYQLVWQSFDLRAAHKLNLLGNEHIAKGARASFAGNRSDARRRHWSIQEAPIGRIP
jgi:hypothetical protein